MGLVSANMMIRSLSLFHVTLAVLLLKNPSTIANQGVILLLGQSMQLPTPRAFYDPSPPLALAALLFAFLGLTDLTAVSLPTPSFDTYWGAQVPIRLLFLFALTGYTYTFKEGGLFAARGQPGDYAGLGGAASGGDLVNNSVVFTWGFVELAAWFWVFVTLREERREEKRKLVEKRAAEADRL